MNKVVFALIALAALAAADQYAIIVGAADQYFNYASESSACRMFADVHRAGVPKKNIITMNYRTAIEMGPIKGKIFTEAAPDESGDWAQYGCFEDMDYFDKQLQPETFLGVLSGDAERVTAATGIENPKVLTATEKDTVFVYFIDHGGDGVIYISSKPIYRKQLEEAIQTAFDKKLYGKMVFFLEACHSGSMFTGFDEKYKVFVETASNPNENAYKDHCPPEDKVGDIRIGTCIGSLWDNIFMEFMEKNTEATFLQIHENSVIEVAKESPQDPQIYGNMAQKDEQYKEYIGAIPPYPPRPRSKSGVTVANHLVPRHVALWKSIRAETAAEKEAAMKELELEVTRLAFDEVVAMRLGRAVFGEKLAHTLSGLPAKHADFDCYQTVLESVSKSCAISMPPTPVLYNMIHNVCGINISTLNIDYANLC